MPLLIATIVAVGVICADHGHVALGGILCLVALAVGLLWSAGTEEAR